MDFSYNDELDLLEEAISWVDLHAREVHNAIHALQVRFISFVLRLSEWLTLILGKTFTFACIWKEKEAHLIIDLKAGVLLYSVADSTEPVCVV
jgi:uncharacterized membrane protein